jgi:hypothetical protein
MLFRLLMPVTLLTLLLVLPGCESAAQRAQRSSPDYRIGYDEGCASAGAQGANTRQDSTTRDEDAYRSNPAYHAGWGAGFNACHLGQAQPTQPGVPAMP